MLEMMKGYLQLAAGLGEMSRRKAMDAARDLVEGTPVAGIRTGTATGAGPEALAGQVAAVADELLTIGRQNRRLLAQLVRTETEAVLASLGVRPDRGTLRGGGERLDDQLRALRDRVDDLERQLRERAATGTVTAGTRTASARRTKAATSTAERARTATTAERARTATTAERTRKATAKRATTTAKRATKAAQVGAPAAGRRASKAASKAATKRATKRATTGRGTAGRGRARGATS